MRTRRELTERYAEQIDWMRASAERFDAGITSEAKRIAVVIRTLVHHTSASTSLLQQLEIQEGMRWKATVPCIEPTAEPGSGGLWASVPNEPGYRPILGEYPHAMNFTDWWSKPVLVTDAGPFTRSDFVLHLVNFDGGAHIDRNLPPKYESLSRHGGFKPIRVNSAGQRYPDNSDPIPSAIRTMAGELYTSLQEHRW